MLYEYEHYVPDSSEKVNISIVGDCTKYEFLRCILKDTNFDISKEQQTENTIEIIPYETEYFTVMFFVIGTQVNENIKKKYEKDLNVELYFMKHEIFAKNVKTGEMMDSSICFDSGFNSSEQRTIAMKSYIHNIVSNYVCKTVLTVNNTEGSLSSVGLNDSIPFELNISLMIKKIMNIIKCRC